MAIGAAGSFSRHHETGSSQPSEPEALQLALARGHRWLQMLEAGEVSSLREIAQLEGLDNSYISRMVNLTTLAPDIVEAILMTVCRSILPYLTWWWTRQG